jgi:Flp pilus assembly protein TadD
MTGLYPDRHGVRDNGRQVPADLITVAEQLRDAGWATGAVVAAVVLDGGLGIGAGFGDYHDGFDLTALEGLHDGRATRTADEVAELALAWTAAAPTDAPAFLWVHVYDPHAPLEPPADFAARHADAYLAEVAFADHHVGRVIEAFEARSARPAVVVVVGDHGEGRGEHGEATHGQLVYRSTMRVPLIVAGHGVAAEVRSGPASVVDVAPTLLQAAGVAPLPGIDGRSLLDGAGADPARRVYGESWHQRYSLGLAQLHVWQDGTTRYVHAPRDELYAWSDDPGERDDLAATRPDELARWQDETRRWMRDRPRRATTGSATDAATRAALERLGYLEGVVAEDVPLEQLPDPKDHPDLQARVDAVITLARTRPPAEAIPLLREFSAAHPGVRVSRVLLVRALDLSGQPGEALAVSRTLLAETPDDPAMLTQTAELHLAEGEGDAARVLVERAVEVAPLDVRVVALLGELERRAGRCAAVLPSLDRALAAAPEGSGARLVRGACRHDLGDLAGAASDLQAVLAADPDNRDVRYLLGVTWLRQGRHADAVPLLAAQVERTPDAVLAQAALGLALLASGEVESAVEPLRRAAPDALSGVDAPLALADALLRTDGPDDEVERWLAVAAARGPDDPRVPQTRASLRMRQGRTQEALDEMVDARARRNRALRGDSP